MIKIRYSPIKDLELSGSVAELYDLKTSILSMLDSLIDEVVIDADNKFDPSPYKFRLSALSIKRLQGPVLVSVKHNQILQIEGSAGSLKAFTSFLDFQPDEQFPGHNHFEYYPGDDKWIASDSIPLVIGIEE